MTYDKILTALVKSKRSVQDEVSDMAAFIHGWNAAVDHMIHLLSRIK